MFFKFLYSLTLLLVLAPALVLAADDTVAPEFNPICWEEQACLEERRKINPNAEASGGWINTEEPCQGKFGKCLPAGVVETEIAFGGQKRFAHVGQFIQVTYKYAVGVAGIVATVMVIVAGFQWITSGGNSERVAGAKKRIGGALMGLFLAYLSYAILDTLNPALVSMRLPRVWLVKPTNLMPEFCSQTPTNTLFALAAPAEDQRRNVELPSRPNFEYSKERTPQMLYCGKRFFIKNGGTAVCRGDYCNNNNEICAQFGEDPANPDKYYCASGLMAGTISGTAGGLSGVQIDNDLELMAICANGISVKVKGIDVDNDSDPNRYIFPAMSEDELKSKCGGNESYIIGFYLRAEVNDETGLVGNLLEGFTPASIGTDDWHDVGIAGGGSHDCSVNLTKLGLPAEINRIGIYDASDFERRITEVFNNMPRLIRDQNFINHLIPYSELKKGFMCNITINRSEFPDVDN